MALDIKNGFVFWKRNPYFWKNTNMILRSPLSPETNGKAKKRKIPAYLIRETIDGVNFYYPGFRQVLNKQKKLENLIGDSGLQFFLKDYLVDQLKAGLDKQKYRIAGGELGFHAGVKNTWGLT